MGLIKSGKHFKLTVRGEVPAEVAKMPKEATQAWILGSVSTSIAFSQYIRQIDAELLQEQPSKPPPGGEPGKPN